MNDTLEEQFLTQSLHHLADGAPVPSTSTRDDVRRGRGRLRKRRAVAALGSAAVVVALAGGFALADSPAEKPQDAPVANGPVGGDPGEVLRVDADLRGQLQSALLGNGNEEAWFTIAELNAMTELLQSKLRGDDVRWFGAERAGSWGAARGDACPSGWTCEDVAVEGAARARFASSGTVVQLLAELPSDTMILTFNTVEERPTDVAYSTG